MKDRWRWCDQAVGGTAARQQPVGSRNAEVEVKSGSYIDKSMRYLKDRWRSCDTAVGQQLPGNKE